MDSIELLHRDFVFLSNKKAFFILSLLSDSRYFGLFFRYKDYYIKILDRIENKKVDKKKVKKIILEDSNIVKLYYENDIYERYILLDDKLVYETNVISNLVPFFDIKHIYDTDEWGRNYNFEIFDNYIKINFSKGDINLSVFLLGYLEYIERGNKWVEIYYNYDYKRRSPPFNRWLYVPFEFKGKRLIVSLNKKFDYKIYKRDITFYDLLKDRLLSFSDGWISAGYPWYFQEWTRDILISLPAFYLIGEKELVRKKLIEYKDIFLDCGKLRNIVNSNIGNCDSVFWYIKRLFEYKRLFNEEEFNRIVFDVKKYFDIYIDKFFDEEENLFFCYPNESWMDTLNRKYPIEIQFLAALSLKYMYEKFREEKYIKIYNKLIESIKKKYVFDNSLLDDIKNPSIRPNIFLSYYIYKDVFSKNDWEKFIDYSLRHLWLDWGGLSSISKFDTRFKEEHNGDNFFNNDKSMHNGDSWIYLNNIAAIVMNDLNKEKYSRYIRKIFEASTSYLKEIGTLPELSSAKNRDISGAISQLWSLATYIEMLKELNININLL